MGLALGQLGLEKDGFYDKFSLLRDRVPEWNPGTWTSIRQLHQSRNLVQHQGVLPAGREISGWAAHSQRFIESLVAAVFDVELRDVLVAETVERDEVRQLLVQAERALEQEDAANSFAASVTAFDTARQMWQGQRVEALGSLMLPYTNTLFGGPETDPVSASLIRFEELFEIQTFAPDVAEYHWLVIRRREHSDQVATSLNDARRGFYFVVAWVLRWEAFSARHEERRYPDLPAPYEPPVTGADAPVIYDVEVEKLHHIGTWLDDPTLENVRYSVKLALADIPDVERELWANEVSEVLNGIISERGTDSASAGYVDARGIVRIHGATARANGPEIVGWLSEGLTEGDRRYRERLAEKQAIAARLPRLRERLATAINAVDAADIVGEVISEEQEEGTRLGVHLRIDDSSDPLLPQVLQNAVIAVLAGRSDVHYFHSTLWFGLEHEPFDAATLVAASAAIYREQAKARDAGLAAVENCRSQLEAELRERALTSRSPTQSA